MKIGRPKNPKMGTARDGKGGQTQLWQNAVKDDVARQIFTTARYLAEHQRARLAGNLHHLRVYSNRLAASLSGSAFTEAVESGERIKLNATKSGIDAAVAQVATNQPNVMHLTTGGSFAQRKRAERLDKYVLGWFHELQLHIAWLGVFLDACIDGLGIIKFIARPDGRIAIERVRSDTIFVDDNECRALVPGRVPRMLIEMRPVAKSMLLANPKLKKNEEEIAGAEYIDYAHPAYAPIDDPVTMCEAFYLPELHGGKGRHVICLSNLVILDEEWTFVDPPYAFFRWNDAPVGFYGIGAVEEVLPIQIELNYLAQKLQRLLHLATSVILRKRGSNMAPMTNEDFAIYDYTGTPPSMLNMQAASTEYYNQIDRLYRLVYEMLGVSQMSATGTKPAGLYSGEAIRLFHDVATRRYRHTEQRASQFFIDCASQIEDRAREIVKRGFGTAATLGFGNRDVEKLDWSDVAMERDMYVMRTRPVSIIPSEPAGKVELIKALAPIAPEMAPYLLGTLSGIPDLEAAVRRASAPREYAERLVSNIIEHGAYEPPDPMADLNEVRRVAQSEALNAESNGVEPDRAALLRRLVAAVDSIQMSQMAPTMAGMGLPGAPGPVRPGDVASAMASAPGLGPQSGLPGGQPGGMMQ